MSYLGNLYCDETLSDDEIEVIDRGRYDNITMTYNEINCPDTLILSKSLILNSLATNLKRRITILTTEPIILSLRSGYMLFDIVNFYILPNIYLLINYDGEVCSNFRLLSQRTISSDKLRFAGCICKLPRSINLNHDKIYYVRDYNKCLTNCESIICDKKLGIKVKRSMNCNIRIHNPINDSNIIYTILLKTNNEERIIHYNKYKIYEIEKDTTITIGIFKLSDNVNDNINIISLIVEEVC